MRATFVIAALSICCFACSPQNDELTTSTLDIENAAQQFLDVAHAFDYAAIRAPTTPDVEFILFGRRMNIDEFEQMMREYETSLEGASMDSYKIRELNTRIVGNLAYTSWSSDEWLEAAVFVRQGDRWILDRASAIPIDNGYSDKMKSLFELAGSRQSSAGVAATK
jgi:hypothetical protein